MKKTVLGARADSSRLARRSPVPPDRGAWEQPSRRRRRSAHLVAFERITTDPDTGGMPTLRGLRIPVATVVATVADRMSVPDITDELPDLTPENVAQALRCAAEAVRERELPLRHSA
jgi:uncharacterized protein (DUF433 family)